MGKDEIQYDVFINEVNPENRGFVNHINDFLIKNGCKIKIEAAKSGHLVSYSNIKTKRVIINFVFRKNVLIIRIYGDNINKYTDFTDTLPEGMIKSIEKAPLCKRLIDPEKCNSRCPMGYDFVLKDKRHQKCRYNSFMFEVNAENIPFIETFLGNEIKERLA